MGAQPSTEADAEGDEEDIFPSIKGNSSFLVSFISNMLCTIEGLVSSAMEDNECVGGVVDGFMNEYIPIQRLVCV